MAPQPPKEGYSPEILELSSYKSADTLSSLLCTLFEPSQPLHNLLVPAVLLELTARSEPPESFNKLIDICIEVSNRWTWEQKAQFLSGHPMIGEVGVKGISGKEQGSGPFTPAIVLERLAHLNELYCIIYPGLRFITFVNSRPRAAIIPEMEGTIGLPISPQPLPDDFAAQEPSMLSPEITEKIKSPESGEWQRECERGLADVWRIGRARLANLGLQ